MKIYVKFHSNETKQGRERKKRTEGKIERIGERIKRKMRQEIKNKLQTSKG